MSLDNTLVSALDLVVENKHYSKKERIEMIEEYSKEAIEEIEKQEET